MGSADWKTLPARFWELVESLGPVPFVCLAGAALAGTVIFVTEVGATRFLDAILRPTDGHGVAISVLAMVALVGLTRALSGILQEGFWHVGSEYLRGRIRVLACLSSLRAACARPIAPTEAQFLISEGADKSTGFFQQGCVFAKLTAQAVLITGYLFLHWPVLAGWCLTGVIAVSLLHRYPALWAQRLGTALPPKFQALTAELATTLKNAAAIYAMGESENRARSLNAKVRDYARASIRARLLIAVSAHLPVVWGTLIVLGVLYLRRLQPSESQASLVAFFYLFSRVLLCLGWLQGSWGNLRFYFPTFLASMNLVLDVGIRGGDRREDTLNQLSWGELWHLVFPTPVAPAVEAAAPRRLPPTAKTPPPVTLRGVAFGYDTGPELWSGIDWEIAAGSFAAITGNNGAGKTTLLHLSIGLYRPSSGEVRIAGDRPVDYLRRFRGDVWLLGAEPFLFEGTVRENLIYGIDPPGDEAVSLALSQFALLERVAKLPQGLDTPYPLGITHFTMGERQRLALARATLANPRLLLMDEATSHFDRPGQELLATALIRWRGKTTVILATHDPFLMAIADNLLHLPSGKSSLRTSSARSAAG